MNRNDRLKSTKEVLPIEKCVTNFKCTFPVEAADRTVNGKKCFRVGINMDSWLIPVGEEIEICKQVWDNLRGINFRYLPKINYDPIRQ